MKKVFSVLLSMVILVTSMTSLGFFNASAAATGKKLEIQDFVTREIVDFSVGFDGDKNASGQMTGNQKARLIKIKVKALNDGNPDLLYWMLQRDLAKNGTIIANDPVSGKEDIRIVFSDAYCVHYEETYEITGSGTEMYEEIWISAPHITVGTVEYNAGW